MAETRSFNEFDAGLRVYEVPPTVRDRLLDDVIDFDVGSSTVGSVPLLSVEVCAPADRTLKE